MAGQHPTTNPTTEMPSNSETAVGGMAGASIVPKDSVRDSDLSNQESKIGQASSTTSNQPGSAEAAAEKLYAERIEDEYAKREGGA